MSSRRRIPPEYVLTSRSAGVREREALEHFLSAAAVLALGEVVPEPDQLEVLAPGQQLVDRGVLAGEPDHASAAAWRR